MVTSRQRSKAKLTHHHTNTDFPGEPGPEDPGPEAPPGIPGRAFPGDPKEQIHQWMTILWEREHEFDENEDELERDPRPPLTEVEKLRELVLHLKGNVEGPGNASSIEDERR